MNAISPDLRKRVVAARQVDGQSLGQIAERYQLPKSSVQTILEHCRETGSLAPKPHGGGRKAAFLGEHLQALEVDLVQRPDATLEQLREQSGLPVSLVAVHNAVKKLGFTRKKSLYVRASSSEAM
jgi:transposase